MKTICLILLLFFVTAGNCFAQTDTEFPKGFIMYAKLHNGLATKFNGAPDPYTGGLQLVPLVTVIPTKLRAGIIADAFYTSTKWQAAFGPTIAIKLKTINAGVFGSAANVNLTLHHLWGTVKQRFIGGGINADLLNLLLLGLTIDRDYNLNYWQFQTSLGIRISKKKKTVEPFNQ
jgi:hypothetical protein